MCFGIMFRILSPPLYPSLVFIYKPMENLSLCVIRINRIAFLFIYLIYSVFIQSLSSAPACISALFTKVEKRKHVTYDEQLHFAS